MHYLGILGVPRRYYAFGNYGLHSRARRTSMNMYIIDRRVRWSAFAQLLFVFNLALERAARTSPPAGNPWRAASLEWQTPETPPVHGNWGPHQPVVYRWAYAYSVPGARRGLHRRRTRRRRPGGHEPEPYESKGAVA